MKLGRHAQGCNGFPVWEAGVMTCACGRVVKRPQSRRKRLGASLVRVALGRRARARLSAFWGRR